MRTRTPSFVLRSTPLVAALACALTPQAASALSFPVSTVPAIASGDVLTVGSLANAILLANTTCILGNTVDLPAGPFTIAPSTSFPQITCSGLTINGNGSTLDGSSSPGVVYGGTACDNSFLGGVIPFAVKNLEVRNYFASNGAICGPVTADGDNVHDTNTGIQVEAGAATITNSTFEFNSTGILVDGSASAAISGNMIGTPDGSSSAENNYGIELYGTPSTISNNVISGNWDGEVGTGIYVDDDGGSSITGNKIGTDSTGASALTNGTGIEIYSPVNISGNVISGNYYYGIYTNTDVTVTNNKIGTDVTGTLAIPNDVGFYGGFLTSASTISGNVISGNSYAGSATAGYYGYGLWLGYSGSLSVSNNMIGTNVSGTAAIPNDVGFYGSYLDPDLTLSNNVISGNTYEGAFYVYSYQAHFQGNKIGTNAAGTAAIPNLEGISANCSDPPTVTGNVLSGNSYSGLSFYGVQGTAVSDVSLNKIGVAANGVSALSNGAFGVLLDDGSWCGTSDNMGMQIVQNTIANNSTGIGMRTGTGNAFSQNLVFANSIKNIDLVPGGSASPLLNDPGDPDSGPNNGQNHPTVDTVMQASGQTTVSYTLDTGPGDYRLEFFSNDTVGNPAGQHYLGSSNITISSGPMSSLNMFSGLSDNISMTATLIDPFSSALSDTSELSPMATAVGTGAFSVAPSAVAFGPVAIFSTSPQRTIVVRSIGTAPFNLASLTDSATCDGGPICSSGGFICSTTCAPGSYAPGSSCNITASFAPTFVGAGQSTSFYVCDDTGSSIGVTLTGDGVVPAPIDIQPPAWDFGTVVIGQNSASQVFAIENPGQVPVTIGTVSTTGDFVLDSTTCASEIAAASQCTANVHFTPSQAGARAGTLDVPYTTPLIGASAPAAKAAILPSSTASSLLSGTGTTQPALDVPASVDLGSYSLGSPGVVRIVTITNTGNTVITIASVTATAPFSVTTDCTQSLNPGDSCHATIAFTSNSVGPFTGTVSVASNAPGGLRTIAVTAIAQTSPTPLIRVSPTQIGFGERLIGSQSPTQRVTISNYGGSDAALTALGASNLDFLVASTSCGVSLAPQSSCFADVVMRPVGLGHRQGQFVVNTNAGGSPHAVDLSGLGCLPFDIANNRLGASSRCGP